MYKSPYYSWQPPPDRSPNRISKILDFFPYSFRRAGHGQVVLATVAVYLNLTFKILRYVRTETENESVKIQQKTYKI